MLESFVIMLREGIEAALVVGMTLVVLKRIGRKDLERSVYWGVGLAVLGSILTAVVLSRLPLSEELYEGTLYWVSAAFVASMMWWMHRNAKTLRQKIQQHVDQAAAVTPQHGRKEAWALGFFAFLMVFREGAEAVLFLSAVNLTTSSMLSLIGSLAGLSFAVAFAVFFVRGSVKVNLRRFFFVTEWILAIFLAQLVINGYHEFSEAGILPATQWTMTVIGPVVRHNSLFILAIVAIPLFVWMSRSRPETAASQTPDTSPAQLRLATAAARRDRVYRWSAIVSTLLVLGSVGVVYAKEVMPKTAPKPELVVRDGDWVRIPAGSVSDGTLHHFALATQGKLVRFLVLKTADGRIRTALDACDICGSFGYIQEDSDLVCLNCAAAINRDSLGIGGGCNPVPLASDVTDGVVRIRAELLDQAAPRFHDQPAIEEIDPVCGMRLRIDEAAAFEVYNGKTYYFCKMPHCHDAFKQDPKAYVK